MPVRYTLRGSLLRMDLIGDSEVEEVVTAFRAAVADPACPPRCALLVDVSHSTSLERRTPDELRRLVDAVRPYVERIGEKCAVVAVRDVHYGFTRMGAAFAAQFGVEAEVFRDERAALEWLGEISSPDPTGHDRDDG